MGNNPPPKKSKSERIIPASIRSSHLSERAWCHGYCRYTSLHCTVHCLFKYSLVPQWSHTELAMWENQPFLLGAFYFLVPFHVHLLDKHRRDSTQSALPPSGPDRRSKCQYFQEFPLQCLIVLFKHVRSSISNEHRRRTLDTLKWLLSAKKIVIGQFMCISYSFYLNQTAITCRGKYFYSHLL